MSYNRRRFPVRHPVVVDIGCNCRRPKLSFLFSSNSRSKARATLTNSSPTTITNSSATFTATTDVSPYEDKESPAKLNSAAESPAKGQGGRRKKKGRVARESVAVVKESAEPYADFRESMVQMIVEKEIYAWEDLNATISFTASSPSIPPATTTSSSAPSPTSGAGYSPPPRPPCVLIGDRTSPSGV